MGNADTSFLPVLLLVTAAAVALSVTVFLLGMTVASRMLKGQSPVGLPKLFAPKPKKSNHSGDLPRITG